MGLFDFFRRNKKDDRFMGKRVISIRPTPTGPRVVPKAGQYFRSVGPMSGVTIYGHCQSSGSDKVRARCFSTMAPNGESGHVDTSTIKAIISRAEFDVAQQNEWRG